MPVLQFKGKTAVEGYHYTVPHHTLDFDAKLSVLPKGQKPGLDGNLILEGDNLLALKALLPTHAGRVKCVYIDPPYNTGNEGWVYNDNLTQPQFKEWFGQTVGREGEDACRHDKWCCMMYPRLQLLKELLRDDGAIFVSIGEDEVATLRLMMDEVFDGTNFVATIIWRNSTGPKQTNQLSISHDYIICYAKNAGSWSRNLLPRTEEQEADYQNPDDDSRGPWRSGGLDARNYYSKGRYSITCPGGRVIEGPPGDSYWRMTEESLWELDAEGRIWWGIDGNNVPRIKRFLKEVQQGLIPQTFWNHSEVGHTQDAKKEVLKVLGQLDSPVTPKPIDLIRRICWIASNPGDTILDSFAGTGTTAHAILAMNADGMGDRNFILVQAAFDTKDNEKDGYNICQRMTQPRVKRVIQGYDYVKRGAKGKTTPMKEAGLGGSFTYARVGRRLFDEYRDLGDAPPAYGELAKYVFYTETSHDFDPKAADANTGRLGEFRGTAYYLLYSPKPDEDGTLDLEWLKTVAAADPCRKLAVYCEKLWVHRDDLLLWQKQSCKAVRTMIVPFNLK